MRFFFFLMLILSLSYQRVFAGMDVRLGYVQHSGKSTDYDEFLNQSCDQCGKKPGPLGGLGIDALYYFPQFPIGLGIRYQNLSDRVSIDSLTFEQTYQMFALLAGYRLWDTEFFGGPKVSFGIADSSTFTLKNSGSTAYSGKANQTQSYSLGFEIGYRFPWVLIGAEISYTSLSASSIRNGDNLFITSGSANLDKIERSGITPTLFAGIIF